MFGWTEGVTVPSDAVDIARYVAQSQGLRLSRVLRALAPHKKPGRKLKHREHECPHCGVRIAVHVERQTRKATIGMVTT